MERERRGEKERETVFSTDTCKQARKKTVLFIQPEVSGHNNEERREE